MAEVRTVPGAPERETLYSEMQPLVRRLLRQYGSSPDLREDLASELYVRYCALYAAFDSSRGIPVRPYMVRMLTQAAYNYMRVQWKQQGREVSLQPSWSDAPEEVNDPGVDPTSEWDQALWMEQAVDHLPRAIAQLPKRQQMIVIWRYYDGRSFEEIADELQVRPATVRSLLRYAINRLREFLGAEQ